PARYRTREASPNGVHGAGRDTSQIAGTVSRSTVHCLERLGIIGAARLPTQTRGNRRHHLLASRGLGRSHRFRSLLVIETEPFCFGLKAEGPVEAMGAISGMALVREKLDLVASGGSGVGKDSPHDGGGDTFAAMADGDDERLDERSRWAVV